jgi:catechol 2,3-dioxygenase-like lactoylglutathione lyase family enzyme
MASVANILDIEYVRLRAPDLDAMETFLVDFGMQVSARTPQCLYMRGTGEASYIHITELADTAGLVAVGLSAANAEDLAKFAKMPGASPVEEVAEPGGGLRVTLTGPEGLRLEVVHGGEKLPRLQVPARGGFNFGTEVQRTNRPTRTARGPSHVKRLGHIALNFADQGAAQAWFEENLGALVSDRIVPPADSGRQIMAFMRCNRGQTPTDHHTLLIGGADELGLNHLGFEVLDFDDIGTGHDYMLERGYRHMWGIGRHTLGSQVFDYWRDPWGHGIEHWSDGDLYNRDVPPEDHPAGIDVFGQWGPLPPADFGSTLIDDGQN